MKHRFSGLPLLSRRFTALLFALLFRLVQPPRAAAENKIEYRYEDYNEDNGRMHIRTHAVGFEQELNAKVTAKGLLVYDGISGATPTGELPALGSSQVPLANVTDIRRALSLDLAIRYNKRGTLTPQFSYSQESDYASRGVSLAHAYDFNDKNTTLLLGAAHNFDSVGGGVLTEFQRKDTTDFLVGVNQLLSPETVLSVNLTLGYSDGYLNDPYRRVTFYVPDSPDSIFFRSGFSERRRGNRQSKSHRAVADDSGREAGACDRTCLGRRAQRTAAEQDRGI